MNSLDADLPPFIPLLVPYIPPPSPPNADLQFITSSITPPKLALHACMHACTRCICIFSKQTPEHPERACVVRLGDKSPPPPSLYENKNTQRGGGSMYTPSVHRSQQGLLIVTCARSAPSQSPVSQMHAGRSGPPHLFLTAPAWQGGCKGGSAAGGGSCLSGERQLAGPQTLISPLHTVAAKGEPRPCSTPVSFPSSWLLQGERGCLDGLPSI